MARPPRRRRCDAIQAIGVSRSDSPYTSGRHIAGPRVSALPSGTTLFDVGGEPSVSRGLTQSRARAIARELAAIVGVPVVDA